MNLVDKTKPSMKYLVQELYTAGLFKDGAIAEMVGFGMFDASDYQDITGKLYSVKSNSSNVQRLLALLVVKQAVQQALVLQLVKQQPQVQLAAIQVMQAVPVMVQIRSR